MLKTLASQLHFVRAIQTVDTSSVKPLHSLRDETREGREQATIGLAEVKDALANEEIVGKHHKRLRRKVMPRDAQGREKWDVLSTAETKAGRYFVVEKDKD